MSLNCAVNAQGLLNKIVKKKQAEPQKTEEKKIGPNELAAIDSADTFLDSREIKKDSRGLSGIYYSSIPVKVFKDLDGVIWAKKFLINYEEGSNRHDIWINTRLAFETTDRTKFAERANFYLDEGGLGKLEKSGVVFTFNRDNGNNRYQYNTHNDTKDLQGNTIFGEDYLNHWGSAEIIEVEPGIIFIGRINITSLDPREKTHKEYLERQRKFEVLVVLYKKEKATEAAKYIASNEVAWDKLAELAKKYHGITGNTSALSDELPIPVTGFKDAPTAAALNVVAQNLLETSPSITDSKFDYVYTTTEWQNIYKTVGASALNTLVGRECKATLVVTTKAGGCGTHNLRVFQENTYTTGTFTENYGTNKLTIPRANSRKDIDCSAAKKYKK
jgi:hypothetical protein